MKTQYLTFVRDHDAYAILKVVTRNIELEMLSAPGGVGLVGSSSCVQALRRRIANTASIEIPVLITGESGVGKEVVAKCIHHCSSRRENPFVALNCGSLTPTLIESELFGHVQGAFTGATRAKHGFFETADGGTLFLDEIGDLPLDLQTRLLRVLDEGEFNRVGETKPRRVDVRIISATNRDLKKMAEENRFRSDIYYRLRGSQIYIAPLRERKDDIPALVCHFLGDETKVTPQAIEALRQFDWPGNVRELSMVVASLKGLCRDKPITMESVHEILGLDGIGDPPANDVAAYNTSRELFDKGYFESLMESTNGNISKASALSGIHRKNLRDKLKTLGMYRQGTKE